ncbi:MAG: IS4 family transposase [Myxococcales bacterium]|nr:IS4 family transposase [Myxococcales bacterium]
MPLGEWLSCVGSRPRSDDFEQFSQAIDMKWVNQALSAAGTKSIRKRKLPSNAVVWLVIGMALFRDRAIPSVLKYLGLGDSGEQPKSDSTGGPVTSGGIVRARDRVGPQPLQELFGICAQHWVNELDGTNDWRGYSLYGVDGSTLRLPDTGELDSYFGRPGTGRAPSAYPQARVVAVMALRSRLLSAFAVGPLSEGEQTLAEPLLQALPPSSLVILDRGFIDYGSFVRIQHGENRHWLCRAKSNLKGRVIQPRQGMDEFIELDINAKRRKEDPTLPDSLKIRVVYYQVRGFQPQRLFTSLLDPVAYPAAELATLYHQRWELELGFGEKKTQLLDRRETIRSKKKDGVLQELWGLALAYNLVRVVMARAARHVGVEPYRISFRNSLWVVRDFLVGAAYIEPGALPRCYNLMIEEIATLILPERRERAYPREVKIKMTGYKRKEPK